MCGSMVDIQSANLECRSQMCMAACGSLKIQDAKNRQKFAIWAPPRNLLTLYLSNKGTYRQSEKNLLNSNICHTCPLIVNFGPLTTGSEFEAPRKFQWV